MDILLSYSYEHFHPGRPPEQEPNWGTSANILARSIHAALSRMGDVTYVDAADPESVRGRSFALYVGSSTNFIHFVHGCHAERVVYIAVNMHPAERNRILLDFVAREGLPATSLSGWDLVDAPMMEAGIAAAHSILCVGNFATYNSYIQRGVSRQKVRVLNYGSEAAGNSASVKRPGARARFVYVASEIGLRKGFDVLASTLSHPLLAGADLHVDVVGRPTNPRYQRMVETLQAELPGRVTHHGWLPATSPEYDEVLRRNDFLLFPSLEEGQAGTVLEAVARGVIPIVSRASGVDWSPLGFWEPALGSDANAYLLLDACALPDSEVERLRRKTHEYHEEHHAGFEGPLADALAGSARGQLWPKVSVVLPVFNKERTIERLLGLLDRALAAYGNVELHVILDGCTDASEERVRRFFAGRSAYPVHIDLTPNLFEVKTNNIGLQAAEGDYGVVLQDDNFIYDENLLFEAVTFLEKNRTAAILGCLAGVNFYPRGTSGLEGPGQIAVEENEVYWRQDADTDPALRDRFFQVDACMRGPLIFRMSFLHEHGYLDEAYAPLYSDDMDICMRAADRGYKVYCALMDVENDSLTMVKYDESKWQWMSQIMRRNTDLFYSRWTPSTDKDYSWVHRTRIAEDAGAQATLLRTRQRVRRRYVLARQRWLHLGRPLALLGAARVRARRTFGRGR